MAVERPAQDRNTSDFGSLGVTLCGGALGIGGRLLACLEKLLTGSADSPKVAPACGAVLAARRGQFLDPAPHPLVVRNLPSTRAGKQGTLSELFHAVPR